MTFGVSDVLKDAAIEQRCILRDHRGLLARAVLADRLNVAVADQDDAAAHVIKTLQHID
ncbi:hypothetical protein [Pseudomonas ogarae]